MHQINKKLKSELVSLMCAYCKTACLLKYMFQNRQILKKVSYRNYVKKKILKNKRFQHSKSYELLNQISKNSLFWNLPTF